MGTVSGADRVLSECSHHTAGRKGTKGGKDLSLVLTAVPDIHKAGRKPSTGDKENILLAFGNCGY